MTICYRYWKSWDSVNRSGDTMKTFMNLMWFRKILRVLKNHHQAWWCILDLAICFKDYYLKIHCTSPVTSSVLQNYSSSNSEIKDNKPMILWYVLNQIQPNSNSLSYIFLDTFVQPVNKYLLNHLIKPMNEIVMC